MMNVKLRKLTMAALMAALAFVGTFFVHIPVPGTQAAYFNVGDIIVYLSAVLPGGWYGIAASAIGSVIADLASGAAIYAPATFIIKAVMTLAVWLFVSKKASIGRFSIGSIIGGCIMVVGYFAYELALFGWAYAAAAIPFNLLQFACGVALAIVLFLVVRKLPLDKISSDAGGEK